LSDVVATRTRSANGKALIARGNRIGPFGPIGARPSPFFSAITRSSFASMRNSQSQSALERKELGRSIRSGCAMVRQARNSLCWEIFAQKITRQIGHPLSRMDALLAGGGARRVKDRASDESANCCSKFDTETANQPRGAVACDLPRGRRYNDFGSILCGPERFLRSMASTSL
jgi:hypothetical protein